MYKIVYFPTEDSVSGVPSSWVTKVNNQTLCYWPSGSFKRNKLVRDNVSPSENWVKWKCRVIGTADSYKLLQSKVREAELVTDIDTEKEVNVNVHKRPKMNSSETHSDTEEEESLLRDILPIRSTASSFEAKNFARSSSASSSPSPPPIAMSAELEQLNKIYALLQENSEKIDRLQKSNEKMAESQKMCFSFINNIHEEMLLVKKYVKRRDYGKDDVSDFKSSLPEIPITSSDELEKTEELLGNEDEMSHLTKLLAELGGSKLSSVVHNIMKHVMNKSVAMQYSLKGKNTKKAFQDLKLYKCVLAAVRRTLHGKNATNYEIDTIISANLVGARDRENGRRERQNRTIVDPILLEVNP